MERLRDHALNPIRNSRGHISRLLVYHLGAAAGAIALAKAGISLENKTAVDIVSGIAVATVFAGEFYFMDRLAKRLPWLSIHHTSLSSRKDRYF